jgi:phosphoserine phosphatase
MRWPPYDHIFFDCDSTLTTVEGIDVLAKLLGKGWRVRVLTEAAMSGDVELEEIYAKRLRTIRPTLGQIRALRQIYKQNIVADAPEVIAALQSLGQQVYIISGGLSEPVADFGTYLGVPRSHIRAVGVEYDQLSGKWWQSLDDESPNPSERYLSYEGVSLTVSDGKARIVREMLDDQMGRTLLIGDGVSDLLAGSAVELFVGFGGVTVRDEVRERAPAYIDSPSLAPLLAVAAGPASLQRLAGSKYRDLVTRSRQLCNSGAITFQDERLKAKFESAYQAVYPWTD